VVIPAHNAVDTLASCLSALVGSHNRHEFDIIVVDDGGNGDLRAFRSADDVAVRATPRKVGPAIARNLGAEGFCGEVIVFLDADVEVAPWSISELIAPIRDERAEATVGNYSADVSGLSFAQQYKQLYISHIYSRRSGHLRNHFWTAIGAVAARTFFEIGGFHYRYFWVPEEDTELGHRLTIHGKRILAVPNASGKHLKSYTLRTLIRNDLRKGISSTSVALRNRTKLTDDRHASPRDILSVVAACGALGVPPLFVSSSPPLALAMTVGLHMLYAKARLDVLRVFSDRGPHFLVKAFLTMLLLDYVRGLAVILGGSAAAIQTLREAREHRRGAARSPARRSHGRRQLLNVRAACQPGERAVVAGPKKTTSKTSL
jgi:GT2 family glycosyltransferase